MSEKEVTACLVVIGNEILSGRTQDKNINWLAVELTKMGINVKEVRVVPDVKQHIIDTVKECSDRYGYIFTTGGIGPTHDDITAESIAECFGTKLELNETAHELLKNHYADELNESRLKMAYIPIGAELKENPISAAPGFKLKNVYVLAGIPSIMQAMFDSIKHELKGGTPTIAKTVIGILSEGMIAIELGKIQDNHQDVEIGSYPFIHEGKLAVSLVVRGVDEPKIDAAIKDITAMVQRVGELFQTAI